MVKDKNLVVYMYGWIFGILMIELNIGVRFYYLWFICKWKRIIKNIIVDIGIIFLIYGFGVSLEF